MYFVSGDKQRLDALRALQAATRHVDEQFLLTAALTQYRAYGPQTANAGVNSIYVADAVLGPRHELVFHKPIGGADVTAAALYDHHSPVDLALHEVIAWRLADALGSPWRELAPVVVWHDPPGIADIRHAGPLIREHPGAAGIATPGTGFDTLVHDAAFFDALIGCQDRHDSNMRSESFPPRLGLIDHGFAFALPNHRHNGYPTAGFFLRLRHGQRRFRVSRMVALDYSGIGSMSPTLAPYEQAALDRLKADLSGLLGIAQLLPDDRADALRDRVLRMDARGEVLGVGEF